MSRLDPRGLWGGAEGKPERNPEINQEPEIVCKLGRRLSELSTLCLLTNVFECLLLAGGMVESKTGPPPMQ